MAERSQFWQTGTTGDGTATITEAQTVEWFRDLTTPRSDSNAPHLSQGPLRGVLGELAVSGTSSPVSVAGGAVSCEGYYYKNTAAVSVTVPTPAASTRIDRIVIRVSHGTTRTARITRIAGTEGAGAPSLTQSAGTTWDIPLATVTITTGGVVSVVDDRVLAQFATNHVKRDGDTMTGPLTTTGLTVNGNAAVSGALTIGGIAPWSSANDGDGSGLDADLVAGVDIAPLRRLGGNATNWGTAGTNAYTPANWRIQVGLATTGGGGQVSVSFPTAFAATPIVVAVAVGSPYTVYPAGPTASAVTITAVNSSGTGISGAFIFWIAIGPAA